MKQRSLHFVHHCLEGVWVVQGQISQHLAVQLNLRFAALAHELGVAHAVLASTCIDSLNPERTELTLLEFASNVCVLKAFLDCVFGNSPDVFPGTVVPFGHFQDFLPASSARDCVIRTRHGLSGLADSAPHRWDLWGWTPVLMCIQMPNWVLMFGTSDL